jgi:DNA polymerase (family 10)
VVSNTEVAGTLAEIADLLDLLGERFKPEAYRRAARSIEALPEGLEKIAARGELQSIPGVGEAISGKVAELLRSGSLAYLERLRAQVPAGVLELMRLPGVGPKTARRFWTELGIEGPAQLSQAIAAGRLSGVKGFAEKKISQLRAASGVVGSAPLPGRVPIEQAWPLAGSIVEALRAVPTVHEVAVAGSLRRARETVGDLDVLVTADRPEAVFDAFSRLPEVREVRLRGPTKETVVLARGLQVDLRVVEPEAFGAALQYFTGSKDHNVRLRSLARELGLKVNEYGVYRGDERVAGRTEQDVYRALGLAWIPPELREDQGEIADAAVGRLPRLVEAPELVSELHAHLSPSPGSRELERLVAAARLRSIRAVGVVVARVRGGKPSWAAPPEMLDGLRGLTNQGVRLVPAVEVEGDLSSVDGDALVAWGAEYLIAVPPEEGPFSAPARRPPAPVRLVAHAGGSVEAARPVLELARACAAAIEVGPGVERFDSIVARVARESGVALAVPTEVGTPAGDPTAAVALGFVRRAGATREDVLNTQELGGRVDLGLPGKGPNALGRPSGRRRR